MILERLERHTYRLEHNPNCPSPYLIRLVGWGKGSIDGKAIWHPCVNVHETTKDAYGYGNTVEAAAIAAFAMADDQRAKGIAAVSSPG